jgi:hypothetical protein
MDLDSSSLPVGTRTRYLAILLQQTTACLVTLDIFTLRLDGRKLRHFISRRSWA